MEEEGVIDTAKVLVKDYVNSLLGGGKPKEDIKKTEASFPLDKQKQRQKIQDKLKNIKKTNKPEGIFNVSLSSKAAGNTEKLNKPSPATIRPTGFEGIYFTGKGETERKNTKEDVNIDDILEKYGKLRDEFKKQEQENKYERTKALTGEEGKLAKDKAAYEAYKSRMDKGEEAATKELESHGKSAMWDKIIDALGRATGSAIGYGQGLDVASHLPKEYTPMYDRKAEDIATMAKLETEQERAKKELESGLKTSQDVYDNIIKSLPENMDTNKLILEILKRTGTKEEDTTKGSTDLLQALKDKNDKDKEKQSTEDFMLDRVKEVQKENAPKLNAVNHAQAMLAENPDPTIQTVINLIRPKEVGLSEDAIRHAWNNTYADVANSKEKVKLILEDLRKALNPSWIKLTAPGGLEYNEYAKRYGTSEIMLRESDKAGIPAATSVPTTSTTTSSATPTKPTIESRIRPGTKGVIEYFNPQGLKGGWYTVEEANAELKSKKPAKKKK